MFVSLDENNNRVFIENAVKGKKYYCPSCGEPLIVKATKSLAVRAYFSHKKGTDCDTFSHDMSDWHLDWQNRFPLENREIPMEKDGIKHRADVFINNTVIEFQHSPISAEEIAARNEFYLSLGYNMVWVFDAEARIKNEYGESIDPLNCRNGGLCWKRVKSQFANGMPQQVTVYLHYKTEVSIPQLNGQKIDILLLLTDVKPKCIAFFDTQVNDKYFYITIDNFLKEYGASINNDVMSVKDIVDCAQKYRQGLKRQKEELERRRINQLFNAMMNSGRRSRRL